MLYFQSFSGEDKKEKPILIILHGLFGSSDNWRSWAGSLTAHFEVILPDLRNHGKSFISQGMNYRELAGDVIELVESINSDNRKVHLMGHSMGGKVAMAMVLMRGELFKTLIVGDIAPKPYPPGHQKIIDGFKALSGKKFNKRGEADEILSSYINDSTLRSFLLKNVHNTEEGYVLSEGMEEVIDSYNDILDWPDFTGDTGFDGPVLFIKGERSPYLEKQDDKIIKPLFPRATIVAIENSGHLFHVENPRRLEEELNRFYRL